MKVTIAAYIQRSGVFTFMIRPTVGLRMPLGENLALFADANYEWAMTDVRVKLSGQNTTSDDVDFSGFGFMFGLSAKF